MAALAATFGAAAVLGVGTAVITGSALALVFGLADAVIGLGAFCIWAWSL